MREADHRRRPFGYLRRRAATVAADVEEELRLHLEMRGAELEARGLSPHEARREALRQFGDLDYTRRYCRQQDERKEDRMQRALVLQDFVQDVCISIRSLLRAPMLTLAIVATVGLGIGATTAIFSAVNAALLRPLPYEDPDRLYRIYTDAAPAKFRFSVADYLALQDQQTQFDRIAAFTDRPMTFSDGERAEVLRGRAVSWTYFSALGVRPIIGRDFTEADGRVGGVRTAIITHALWQERLGGSRGAIGAPIRLDGADYVVVGVLPPRLGPLERRQDFFVAEQFSPPERRGPFFWWVIGRLRADSDPGWAAQELAAINRAIFPIWRASYQDDRATWDLEDLKSFVVGDIGSTAGVALAAVALVWLIACTNASNLLVARVTSRRRELAVRAALGASRGRVVRFLIAESIVLATGAVMLGTALAWAGMRLLQSVGAIYFPRMQEIAIDGAVVGVLGALMLMSALIFGLIPALHGTGGPVDQSLRSIGRSSTSSIGVRRLRRVLVGAQFAITTPLMVVAALLLVSLSALQRVDLGFDRQNVVTGSVRLPAALYAEPAQRTAFWDELQRRLESLPGVASVAFADGRPPDGVGNFNNFDLEQFPTPAGQSQPVTPWVAVTPEYPGVLGLPLIEGRLLDRRDAEQENLESVLVDRAWARRFFPNESAVGKRFREGGCTACPWTTVVGVVGEVKYAGLDRPDQGTVYAPLSLAARFRYVVLRADRNPASVAAEVQQVVRAIEPGAPFSEVATVDDLVAESLEQPQSLSLLVAGFAVAAFVLAVVGIYGVMGYYVQQHLKEIGIRMALGGTAADVMRLVLGQGLTVAAGGVVVGVLAALVLTRFIASLLFGVGATDIVTFVSVSAALIASALAACWAPARRAVRVEPSVVLRTE